VAGAAKIPVEGVVPEIVMMGCPASLTPPKERVRVPATAPLASRASRERKLSTVRPSAKDTVYSVNVGGVPALNLALDVTSWVRKPAGR